MKKHTKKHMKKHTKKHMKKHTSRERFLNGGNLVYNVNKSCIFHPNLPGKIMPNTLPDISNPIKVNRIYSK